MAMILGVILIIHQVLKKRDKIKNQKIKNLMEILAEVFMWNYIISYYLNAQGLATFYTLIELQSLKDHGPPVVMLVSLFVDLLNFILIFFILSRLMAKSREIQKELKEN
jgi:hypothetical protein